MVALIMYPVKLQTCGMNRFLYHMNAKATTLNTRVVHTGLGEFLSINPCTLFPGSGENTHKEKQHPLPQLILWLSPTPLTHTLL